MLSIKYFELFKMILFSLFLKFIYFLTVNIDSFFLIGFFVVVEQKKNVLFYLFKSIFRRKNNSSVKNDKKTLSCLWQKKCLQIIPQKENEKLMKWWTAIKLIENKWGKKWR